MIFSRGFLQAWSKLVTKEGAPCPVGRLTHGSVCLGYGSDHPQLLVVGGVGVDEAQGMCYEDATSIWILDLRSESWREVKGAGFHLGFFVWGESVQIKACVQSF